MQQFDLIIIGQGYAGLKAAKLALEKGLDVATVEAMFPGGLVMNINELHPGPEGEVPCGPELTASLAMELMDGGSHNVSAPADNIEAVDEGWRVSAGGESLQARNLIVATGARLRKLGVPGEAEFEGRGVSTCADCDGPLFQGKEAVVVGGGDAAFQEAQALSAYVEKVTILMRGEAPRARADFVEHVIANPAIELLTDVQVEAILGDSAAGVTAVRLLDGEGERRDLPCSAVFAFIGLEPATEIVSSLLQTDEQGAIITAESLQASLPGAWAIGAARKGFGGKLSDAAADADKVVAEIG